MHASPIVFRAVRAVDGAPARRSPANADHADGMGRRGATGSP